LIPEVYDGIDLWNEEIIVIPPTSIGKRYYEMMGGVTVCLSVCLYVGCVDLNREWKVVGSPKLA